MNGIDLFVFAMNESSPHEGEFEGSLEVFFFLYFFLVRFRLWGQVLVIDM